MPDVGQLPEWLGAAVVSAVVAALGYVAKQLLDWVAAVREARATRFARLIELQALLRAAWVSFAIQNSHAQRLLAMIGETHPGVAAAGEGYERTFSKAYAVFTPDERELHAIVRSITINSLRPTNESLLEWLKRDMHFRAQWHRKGVGGELARKLADLEAHLLLWHAKYEAWIPNMPEHALVYLADEEAHGMGFPTGIDEVVQKALEERSLFGG